MVRKHFKTNKDGKHSGRVRDVVRGAPHRVVGQFAWVKQHRRNIQWESRPERDAIRIAAVDHRVIDIQEQPFVLDYWFEGSLHEYTPDLKLALLNEMPLVVEVKEFAEANTEENKARFSEISRVLANEGHDFAVWTEREFRRKPLLENATYVLRYRNYPFEYEETSRVRTLLENLGSLTASALGNHCGPKVTTESLFAMVCFGLIHVDCNSPLGFDPIFYPVRNNA